MTIKEMIEEVKRISGSDTVMISFSGGKDAWAVWCAIKDLVDFQPFYYYCGPPHLEFVDKYLDYAEKKMGKRIIRLPAPNTYFQLSAKGLVAQPPHRVLPLMAIDMATFTFEDVQDAAIEVAGLPSTTFSALGVRAADSIRRATHFKKHGPISPKQKKFYPVWDWKKDRLIEELKRHDVKLSADYRLFGRSFDGLYYMYLKQIKEYYPEDYKKILEYFPLNDMEIYRHEKRKALGF